MNHPECRLARCTRALLALALLGSGTHALALDAAAPQSLKVVVIDETARGWDKGVLYKYGIASRASNLNKGPQADALYKALGDSNIRSRLVIPTGCPTKSTREACDNVRRIADVDLPAAIADAQDGTLLIMWPEAAYFPQEQLYLAYIDVDVLQQGKVVPGPFYLGYRDWECDEGCVPTAFEASAKEIAAMVRYMLELGPAAQSRSIPAAWLSKPVVANVDKWANACAAKFDQNRLVRQYGERFWLNDRDSRTLTSIAWRGCNIFSAQL